MAIPLLIAGVIISAVAIQQQGKAAEAQAKSEQDILNFNARVKEQEAEEVRQASAEEAREFEKRAKAFRGTQRAATARAGVLSTVGTPALLLEQTAQDLEADRLAILKQGFLRGRFLESEATGQRFLGESARARGKNLKRGAELQAAGTLLTGVGRVGESRQSRGLNPFSPGKAK